MKLPIILVWATCFLIPLIIAFRGEKKAPQLHLHKRHSPTTVTSKSKRTKLDEARQDQQRKERALTTLTELLLMRDGSLVSLDTFEKRLSLQVKNFEPNSKGYQMLLTSAYLDSILRLEEFADRVSFDSQVQEIFHYDAALIDRHLDKAIRIYGLEQGLSMVGGIQQLSSDQINRLVLGISPDQLNDLTNLVSQSKLGNQLEEKALLAIFSAPGAQLALDKKWTFLAGLKTGSKKNEALTALADFLSSSADSPSLPSSPLTNENDKRLFRAKYAEALLQKNFNLAVRFLQENEASMTDLEERLLTKAAASAGDQDLLRLNELMEQSQSPSIKSALKHGQLKAWAAFNPEEAAKDAYQGLQDGDTKLAHLSTALHDWFSFSPEKAVEFLRKADLAEADRDSLIDPYLSEIARTAPALYESLLAERAPEFRENNWRSILEADFEVSPTQALNRIDKIEAPEQKFDGYVAYANLVAIDNLQQAIELAARATDSDKRDAFILGTVPNATNADPHLSHQLIGEVTNINLQYNLYRDWFRSTLNKEPALALNFIEATKTSNPELYQFINK